jgi:hypothetical protein
MRLGLGLGVMVFNAAFNHISVILWQSVLLEEETGVHREKSLRIYNEIGTFMVLITW